MLRLADSTDRFGGVKSDFLSIVVMTNPQLGKMVGIGSVAVVIQCVVQGDGKSIKTQTFFSFSSLLCDAG